MLFSPRYGNEPSFLDATYKTTLYALPLFFLLVKTNVDYQIVAIFICEGESTQNITEALNVIKTSNSSWPPMYFMTHYSDKEIGAIESIFPGRSIFSQLKYLHMDISTSYNDVPFLVRKIRCN